MPDDTSHVEHTEMADKFARTNSGLRCSIRLRDTATRPCRTVGFISSASTRRFWRQGGSGDDFRAGIERAVPPRGYLPGPQR
jgi:hypothetical protein